MSGGRKEEGNVGRSCAMTLAMVGVLGWSVCAQPNAEDDPGVMPQNAKTRPFRLGFTPFPWDYGDEVRQQSLAFVSAEGGDIILHHCDFCVPWPEAAADEPIAAALEANWEGYPDKAFNTTPPRTYLPEGSKLYLALTPMDMNRSGLAIDRRGGFRDWTADTPFNDPSVKQAYLNYCQQALNHFRPDYLAIGVEMNELLHNAPGRWPGFVELYRYVYDALKADHPDLPIFATMTLHNLLVHAREPDSEDRKKLQEFLQYNDLLGVSFYSFLNTIGPPKHLCLLSTGYVNSPATSPSRSLRRGILPRRPRIPSGHRCQGVPRSSRATSRRSLTRQRETSTASSSCSYTGITT